MILGSMHNCSKYSEARKENGISKEAIFLVRVGVARPPRCGTIGIVNSLAFFDLSKIKVCVVHAFLMKITTNRDPCK